MSRNSSAPLPGAGACASARHTRSDPTAKAVRAQTVLEFPNIELIDAGFLQIHIMTICEKSTKPGGATIGKHAWILQINSRID
jgi:hypothetical protein